ncbi:hypothetical protein HMPREF9489_0599 [Finegoldia magna SY403409CC001050417]|uniref:polymorphic toxin type 50 domain-containing protein n=1 Tax=Finegoldia magna TaxID=1260 RepID=UPI00021A29CE|nr:polymorphic toxin type 50 domain-containing protein [Finegoldia magna]EGS34163.1 hypothetical protein HMPREF9489_0599 [Finegoldia magna SY403409CC001050417]
MDKDIVPDLLDLIEKSFQNKFKKDEKIKKLETLLFEKKSNHMSSNEYAMRLGDILSECYLENISEGILPNETMYYNIAKRIIEPTLKKNYELVSTYASDTQTNLNRQAGLNIKGLKPEINQDRIDGIINRVSEDKFDKTKWVLKEPIANFTQAVVDDIVKTNAEFHSNLGLSPKIVRKEHGNCCDWCKKLVGSYNYDDISNTGNDVFRRHRHCRCTVEYVPDKKSRQNVHTKRKRNSNFSNQRIQKAQELQDIRALNRHEDSLQYKQYISVLGKDKMPKSLSAFQKLKYENIEEYEKLKDHVFIQNNFNKGIWKDKVNFDKQKRHMQSTAGENKSYFYDDIDIEKLYNDYKMTGRIEKDRKGNRKSTEKITLNEKKN